MFAVGTAIDEYSMTKSDLLTLLLVLWSLNLAASEVYYITTTPMDPSCAGQCLTLSQYAKNLNDLYPNTTIIFLPGIHYLNIALTISNVDNFAMRSENSTVYIVCENYSNIYFNHSHNIEITNLEFIGCGGNQVKHVVEFIVRDTKFEGHQESGTALELIDTKTQIINSTFVSNRGGSYRRCVLYDPYDGCYDVFIGGAIIATNSSIDISLCTFENNGAHLGGAIFVEQFSTISMSDNLFKDNTAALSGVLECRNSTITIEATKFHHNSGIGILYLYNCTITAEASEFHENKPTRWGGVLESEDSTIIVSGTKFRGQENINGTALMLIKTGAKIVNSTFVSNRGSCDPYYGCNSGLIGGAIIATRSTIIELSLSNFEYNSAVYGGAMCVQWYSIINMSHNVFNHNTVTHSGGVLESKSGNIITIEANRFHHNSADFGGVVNTFNSNVTIVASRFHDNSANGTGGVLASAGGTTTIETSVFHNNNAIAGGVLGTSYNYYGTMDNGSAMGTPLNSFITGRITVTIIETSEFHGNAASSYGGILYSDKGAIFIGDSNFTNNSSPLGAVIYAIRGSKIQHHNSLIIDNNWRAVIYLTDSEFKERHDSENFIFSNNFGSIMMFNSNITFVSNGLFINNQSPTTTDDFQEGGAMTLLQSNAFFEGTCIFEHNHAKNGGAIYSSESIVFVNGNVTILHNTASKSGGGVYLSTGALNFQQRSNFALFGNSAAQKGGGVHAVSSSIKATSAFVWPHYTGTRINFTSNAAKRGGGLSLEANAKLYILKHDKIALKYLTCDTNTTVFIANSADYGGAVYVDDDSISGTCAIDSKTECFFQVLALYDENDNVLRKMQSIYFSQNNANILGSALYGGLLDRCAVSRFAEVNRDYYCYKCDGIIYFKDISIPAYQVENSTNEAIISTNLSVASGPVQVCFCINNTQHDCTHQSDIEVKKGESFIKSLIAIDQIGKPINAIIQSFLTFPDSSLAEGQLARKIPAKCTNLTFNIFSEHDSENLTLYASDGPCKDAELSRATVEVCFLDCRCPVGLQVSGMNKTNCTCECHNDISLYMEKCNSHTGLLYKKTSIQSLDFLHQ